MKTLKPPIIYFPANKPYSFSHSVWPTYFRNKDIHYRFYQTRKDCRSVLIKESITFWIVFALLVCGILFAIHAGRISWMEIVDTFLLTITAVPLIYLIKVYLYHLEPARVYRKTQRLFARCTIDNSLMEIEPQCFIFRKDAYDFRLKYYRGLRTYYQLTIYFRYSLPDIQQEVVDNFNKEMKGGWKIGKNYPFMATCTLPEHTASAQFGSMISKVLVKLHDIGFMPSAHVESIESAPHNNYLIPKRP